MTTGKVILFFLLPVLIKAKRHGLDHVLIRPQIAFCGMVTVFENLVWTAQPSI